MEVRMPSNESRWLDTVSRTPLVRVFSLALLLLLLQIPVSVIRGLVHERQYRSFEATEEVSAKHGKQQSLVGPILRIPYTEVVTSVHEGRERSREVERTASFLPEELGITARVASEVRTRGIFEVPVYHSEIHVEGRFTAPSFDGWEVEPGRIHWDRAWISVGLSDPRVITAPVALSWADAAIPFDAGWGRGGGEGAGIHAPVPDPRAGALPFAFDLSLNGSDGLYFTPFGRDTRVSVVSDWPHPSFQGGWLPVEREVSAEGFQAKWRIPYLGRSYPQAWTSRSTPGERIEESRFGVSFTTPVDAYRLVERSAKYDVLFLGLTFLALWLFEVLVGVRVHAVQYLMVGAAMSLFYLLLLAFSEHIGFGLAYALASGGVIALIGGYAVAILRQRKRGSAIGGVVAALYAALYLLLHNEDHALLVGAVGIFVVLALVMWLTRKVDWSEALPSAGALAGGTVASTPPPNGA
jgi:inner membrane protein